MVEPVIPDAALGPARPEKLTVAYYEEPDTLVIHTRRGGGPAGFLLLWLIGWTVACVTLLGEFIKDPTLATFAFALPFWASWLFVAGLLVWMRYGKETLILGTDDAIFMRSALIRLGERTVPRAEVQGFRECRSSHTENGQHLRGIEMVTLGKPLQFAFRLPDREREWLVFRLNRFLEGVKLNEERHTLPPAPRHDVEGDPIGRLERHHDPIIRFQNQRHGW